MSNIDNIHVRVHIPQVTLIDVLIAVLSATWFISNLSPFRPAIVVVARTQYFPDV